MPLPAAFNFALALLESEAQLADALKETLAGACHPGSVGSVCTYNSQSQTCVCRQRQTAGTHDEGEGSGIGICDAAHCRQDTVSHTIFDSSGRTAVFRLTNPSHRVERLRLVAEVPPSPCPPLPSGEGLSKYSVSLVASAALEARGAWMSVLGLTRRHEEVWANGIQMCTYASSVAICMYSILGCDACTNLGQQPRVSDQSSANQWNG
jgi:hypothetical protein